MGQWGDPVEDLIDKEIDADYKKRRAKRTVSERFSASNAGYCQRATILNRLRAAETEKTEKDKRNLWFGTLIHDGFEATLKKSGKLIQAERFLKPPGGYVWGASDFEVRDIDGSIVLTELKSINPGGFWTKIIKNKKPHKHHVYQGVTYILMYKSVGIRVDKLQITYVNKSQAEMRTFKIDLTPELFKEVMDWWEEVQQYFLAKKLPKAFDKDSTEEDQRKCNTCTFRSFYCDPDNQAVEQNINALVWSNDALSRPKQESGLDATKEVRDNPTTVQPNT